MEGFTLDGQVVMVTGAGGNLGGAVVAELAAAGAKIACVERDEGALERTVASLGSEADILRIASVDLADATSCRSAVEKTLERFGHLDALANTVGGFRTGPVDVDGAEAWEALFRMNALTAYSITAAVLVPMQARGYGRIVHVAAAPGLKAGANQAAYAASKGAVIRLTEAVAAENRVHRISANCILPGTIDTPQNRSAMPNAKTDTWVKPASIAGLIAFLTSPAAGVVTGAAIPATGNV